MSIAGTQGDTLFIDLDNDGVVDPGETLLTSGAFSDNGAFGALTIPLSEPVAAPSPDTPSAAPVAAGDSYSTVGNTLLIVGTVAGAPSGPAVTVAGSVIANDVDTLGAPLVISAFDAASVNGGTVTMITNGANQGSFTYLPAVGFTGSDSFTYTLRDSGADGIAGNGDDVTSVATVSITVANRVWYVDNSGANGDGRSTSPFNSLAAVNAGGDPDVAGDIIYVRTGSGTYTGGVVLENGQTLWGENEALVVNGFTLQGAGGDPTIANATGSGVTLAQNNTLKGFTVGDTSVADIVDGNGTVGNLVISNVNLTGTGQAIDIDQGGALNVTIDSLTSTSSTAQGVQLAGADLSGTFTASSGSISGATGAAFLVGDGAGGVTTGGTLAITYGGSISSTTGRAVDIEDRAAGAGDIILSGNIVHASGTSEGVFLDDNAAGNILFSGGSKAINTTAGGASGISISDQSGGAVLFTNTVDIDTAAGTGVNLTGNAGSAIAFSGGSLAIDSTTGVGFNATGGGIVSVQGAGNAIRSTSATALNVVDTTIAPGGLTFASVSAGNNDGAADPVNGIVLNNTGASGGLSIVGSAGSATLGSGGTIQNTSGAGISLTNTRDVVLDEMQISNTGGSGVSGTEVTNFSFTNGAIDEAGNGGFESAIAFNGAGVDPALSGTLTVTGSTFLNSFYAALDVRGEGGIISSANLSGNTITNPGSSGISFDGAGNNFTVLSIEDATIANNVITGSGGSGISIALENLGAAGLGPQAGFVTHELTGPKPFSDPDHLISITGNTISLDATGTNAIALTNHAASIDRGELNFEIRNNILSGSAADSVVRVSTNGTADTVGVIDDNDIDANHTPNLGFKSGINVSVGPGGAGSFWNPEVTIDITNNTVSETDSFGIVVRAGGAESESYVTIANNNVAAPFETGASGIFVQAGDPGSGSDSVFLKIFGNTSAGNGTSGIGLGKQGTDARVNVFGIFDSPGGPTLSIPPTNAGVQAFITALNPSGNGATVVAGDHFVKFDTDGAPNHFGPFPPVALPVNVVPAAQTASVATNLTISGTGVTAAAGVPLQVTLSATNGALSLAPGSAASLTFTAGDGASDATMTFTGTTAEVNAALASLTYRSQPNFAGTDTITLTTSSLAGLLDGATPTDTNTISVFVAGAPPNVIGGPGDDFLVGTAGSDSIAGQDGNDLLDGAPGDDLLDGGLGNDIYIVGDALDAIADAGGIDTVRSFIPWTLAAGLEHLMLLGSATLGVGNADANWMIGNAAANTLVGAGGADIIAGEAGDDWIEGERGNNPLLAGETAGADIIAGGAGNDTILAGGGNDFVHGESGNDTIIGEGGGDVIYGGEGFDAIDGGDGGDVLYGGSEADILFGAADSDTLFGGEGNDIMMGERGEDSVLGALDILYGEGGNDQLAGGAGNDWIFGGDGADIIDGSYGSDLIVGGPGAEIMLGSGASEFSVARAGNDLFVYTGMVDAGDQIWGFDTRPGDTDGIDLRALFDNINYSGLTPRLDGILSVSQGATPTDTVVSIDSNGGGDSYSVLLTLHGVTPATLTDAFFLFQ